MSPSEEKPCVQFFLTPDRASARRLRRAIAETKAPLGIVVGTWIELLAIAEEAYLLATPENDNWQEVLCGNLDGIKNAFWAGSLAVAHEETAAAINQALVTLWSALGPEKSISGLTEKKRTPRLDRHLADLSRLEKQLGENRPAELARMQALLQVHSDEAMREIAVSHVEGLPVLDPWQNALLDKLAADRTSTPDQTLHALQEKVLKPDPQGSSGTSLAHIQAGLFAPSTKKAPKDWSLFGLATRDYITEVEVTTGMIQKAITKDKLDYRGIALLVPNTSQYLNTISQVFSQAGIPLSGLPAEYIHRDLAFEVLDYFLMGFEGPVPAMALAALLTSPLMPWTNEQGHRLADRLMNGDFSLKPLPGLSKKQDAMLGLIRERRDGADDIQASLSDFIKSMDDSEDIALHIERAQQWVNDISQGIGASGPPEATILRKSLHAIEIRDTLDMDLSQEGVAVFLEGEEPWRSVQRLFVIGFSQGHFPGLPGTSPVFFDEDLEALKTGDGIPVKTKADLMLERRALLSRQFCSAQERLVFTVPKRDALGIELLASNTLTFIENVLKTDETDPLVIDLEQSENLEKVDDLVLAKKAKAKAPTIAFDRTLSFDESLLAIRKTSDGEPRPESPSSLETLVVSPFGWLLQRLYAEPVPWQPEDFNPLVKGNLTHAVFENLFKPESPLPKAGEIPDLVDRYFDEAIRSLMPLLRTSAWHVERQSLRRVMIAAAIQWRDALDAMGATIIGNEVWLHGNLSGMPIHGGADVIIQLPDKRLYVVDYKTATSGPRRERMAKGFDSQASLYRVMIKTGGLKDSEKDPDGKAGEALKSAVEIGVLYYMLNDQTGIADTDGWTEGKIPAIIELSTEVSENVFPMIENRLSELAKGIIHLNTEDDEKWFKTQAKTTPYALETSPLIRLFMCPPEPETEGTSP